MWSKEGLRKASHRIITSEYFNPLFLHNFWSTGMVFYVANGHTIHLYLSYSYSWNSAVGGSKNTNSQNSMGALSNPISFALKDFKTVFRFCCSSIGRPSPKKFRLQWEFQWENDQNIKNGQKSLFRGPKWFPKCLNGGFRGDICIEKWS